MVGFRDSQGWLHGAPGVPNVPNDLKGLIMKAGA